MNHSNLLMKRVGENVNSLISEGYFIVTFSEKMCFAKLKHHRNGNIVVVKPYCSGLGVFKNNKLIKNEACY